MIPVENAEALAQSLMAGLTGESQEKPEWLVEHERIERDKAVARVQESVGNLEISPQSPSASG